SRLYFRVFGSFANQIDEVWTFIVQNSNKIIAQRTSIAHSGQEVNWSTTLRFQCKTRMQKRPRCCLKKNIFSSVDLPPQLDDRARFALWQDIHVAEIWSVEYAISGNRPFEAAIEAAAIGPLVVGKMAGTIQHASRKASNIADDGRDGYLLLVNNGDTLLSGTQTGRDYSVGRGEGALVSASDALEMTGRDWNVWANVVVPRAILQNAFPHIDDRLALPIGTDNEALDMLKRYCSFLEAGPAMVSPDLVNHATETVVDLIGLATGAKGEPAELAGLRGLRAARLQAIWRRSGTISPIPPSRPSVSPSNCGSRRAMSMTSCRKPG
ncbi:MAG: hypothetical protein ABJB10_19605, partial [Mesorhizobium sp.]